MIVSSEIISDVRQIDGRRSVVERHVSDDGKEVIVSYMAEARADARLEMLVRSAQIDEDIVDQEAIRQSERTLDRERAQAMLALRDADIQAILRLRPEDVVAAKLDLSAAL